MNQVDGVIFDVDGTLVDSNDAHAQAWADAIKETGRPITFEIVRTLIGMGSDKLLPHVTDLSPDSPQAKAISQRQGQIFKQHYLSTLKPMHGARELVEQLKSDGFQLAIASSARKDELDPLLDIAGVRGLFDEKAIASDAPKSKPSPDVVSAALQRLTLDPVSVVLIGDTPYDVEAGLAAGVQVLALRCGGWNDDALIGALSVYQDPADLLAHYDTSVFKRRRR